jgi:hypothetical protein
MLDDISNGFAKPVDIKEVQEATELRKVGDEELRKNSRLKRVIKDGGATVKL